SPETDPNLIRVFDEFGREMFITKEHWRIKVLPGTLQSNWNNPDQLYGIIIGSLNDGFFADVLDAAKRLYDVDPIAMRGACAYGIVLMKNNRLDDAEAVFLAHIRNHGEEGVVLTNLAKVYAARSETQKADETLWKALTLDPNQDNGLYWYAANFHERFGEAAWLEAIARVAELPGSWRPQLWLARAALDASDIAKALAYYQQSLDRTGNDVPTDLLMQIGGDLGQRGLLKESIGLTEPRFKPAIHGLRVGNNLIKGHLDLGEVEAAQKVLEQLYALQRPDFKKHLSFWDTEIAKAMVAKANSPNVPTPQISMSAVEGPIWLKSSLPESGLFGEKSQAAPFVTFLGSSADAPGKTDREQRQLADAPGRLSRSLPLFLAEQVWFNTNARTQILTPTIEGTARAFVLSGVSWQDEAAARYASWGERKSDFVVVTHLQCAGEQWKAALRIIRTDNHEVLDQFEVTFPMEQPNDAIQQLTQSLLSLLCSSAPVARRESPKLYQVPVDASFPLYLLRLEQLLAIRFAAMDGPQSSFLHGERDIIDGNMQLCVDCPDNIVTRILLARTLLSMRAARPELIKEFKGKIELLQRKKPLPQPAQEILNNLIKEAFTV
ncbi:MAG: tetratricopeptide repeat protein, partial [Terracidiphilus sp.]